MCMTKDLTDESDNDLGVFLNYFKVAILGIFPEAVGEYIDEKNLIVPDPLSDVYLP